MADSPKLIQLFCNRASITEVRLYRFRAWLPDSLGVCVYGEAGPTGRPKVTGSSGLKGTQAYPLEFGFAVAKTYDGFVRSFGGGLEELQSIAGPDTAVMWADIWGPVSDTWTDADLLGPCAILKEIAVQRGVCL